MPTVEHHHWGRIRYAEALERQQARWEAVRDELAAEAVFTLEHEPVITFGKRGRDTDLRLSREALAERGIDVVETNRGGELTYHGPGQLVIYPILAIKRRGIAVGDLVRGLAGAVAAELDELGIQTEYRADAPGLWVGPAKICAVGMRISRGVSMHGAAVNVSTELDAFSLFVPCGMPQATATSIADQGVPVPELIDLGRRVVGRLATAFGLEIQPAS